MTICFFYNMRLTAVWSKNVNKLSSIRLVYTMTYLFCLGKKRNPTTEVASPYIQINYIKDKRTQIYAQQFNAEYKVTDKAMNALFSNSSIIKRNIDVLIILVMTLIKKSCLRTNRRLPSGMGVVSHFTLVRSQGAGQGSFSLCQIVSYSVTPCDTV